MWNRPTESAVLAISQSHLSWNAIRRVTSPRQFEIIIMRLICGMSTRRIADELEMSPRCVRQHLSVGVRRVQENLKKVTYG